MPYRCAKFERNQTTGRLFLCGSKILQKQCEEEEEENVKKIGQFLEVYGRVQKKLTQRNSNYVRNYGLITITGRNFVRNYDLIAYVITT